MKRIFKNGLAITLAAALLVPSFSVNAESKITVPEASVVETETAASLADLLAERNYGHLDDGSETTGLAEELVSFSSLSGAKHKAKYDPRSGKLGYKLPAIRNQGSFGTCWAHALVGCMEISAIKNSKMANSLDLSEVELVSATYTHPGNDPIGNLKKDKYSTEFYIRKADMGGTTKWGINPLLNRVGLSTEKSNAKLKYTASNMNKYAYKKLDSKLAYKKLSVDVHDYAILKNPTQDVIKTAIETFGAVKVSYGAFNETTNMKTGGIYNPSNYGTNHDVVIVGWDDSYSRNNFRDDNKYAGKPSRNGAWIIRNSWGKNVGKAGYFFMSYEDKTACEFTIVEGVSSSKDKFNKVYQYDSMPYNATNYYNKVANTFKAAGNEKLGAVSFECVAVKGDSYKVEIYTGSSDTNPTSGKKVATASGKFKYTSDASNKYVKLSKTVSLKKGQKFTVVVTTTGNSRVLCDDEKGVLFGSSYYDLDAKLTKKPDNTTKISYINPGYGWYKAQYQHCIKAFTKK